MVVLVVVLVVLFGAWALVAMAFGPALPGRFGTGAEDPDVPEPAQPADDMCSFESDLVARRLVGRLSAAEYQLAMASLAVQDATRNPVVVPPDDTA